ncbi:MAG: hypothetical protein HQ538_01670, partial [Parcubacteria group bacterium]|nr:hypothetical protein [Parcubacteria group bacterium]
MTENETLSPIENEEQITDEQLAQQFEQDNQDLIDAFSIDSDNYKKYRDTYIENIRQKQEIERLKREKGESDERYESEKKEKKATLAELEKAKERIKELMFDSVTGFSKRERLYLKLENELPELLGANIEDLEPEDLSKLFKTKADELKDESLSVMMSDVSFLSLANEKGHASGDQLLRLIGNAGREAGAPSAENYEEDGKYDFEAQRHGGDEMTAIIRSDLSGAKEKALEFKLKVSKQEIGKALYGLQPNIDTGVAHISEALEALKELSEDEM